MTTSPRLAAIRIGLGVAGIALTSVILFAGCGGDDDEVATATSPAPATAAAGDGGGLRVQVTAQDIAFSPTRVTVPAGQEITIVFTNNDATVPHNFHILDTGQKTEQFTGQEGPSAELVVRFDQPGEYAFQCDVHPGIMTGTIVAE